MSARIKRIAARSVLVAMLVGLGCLIAASTAVGNPPGIPAGYHKVFQFNVIGYPEGQSYNGNCGNGRRIFVNRNTNNAKVRVSEEGVWEIVDCDATADKTAMIHSDMPAEYVVYARILGKPKRKGSLTWVPAPSRRRRAATANRVHPATWANISTDSATSSRSMPCSIPKQWASNPRP